jgi:putative hemolysin
MKKIITFTIILMALTACTVFQVQTLENTGTDIPQARMPNPASVYCAQQGNKLEISTAADGSQNGICIFPDGSTCDEWAYFRGECGPALQKSPTPGTTEDVSDWWGIIKSTPPGAQYDDYFERQDLGQVIIYGIDSIDPEVSSQIKALRDSGKIVHLYGILDNNVPDYNGSQIQPDRIEVKE